MNPKVALAILVVIVAAFVVGISSGACHSGNTTNASWVDAMQGAFVHKQALDMRDVTATPAGCVQGDSWVIPALGSCSYRIRASDAQVRQMKLIAGPVSVEIHYNNNTPPTPSSGNLKPTDPKPYVAIYSAGGTVSIRCLVTVQCVLAPSAG